MRKSKVKLSLRPTEHHAMKTHWGSGCIVPRILQAKCIVVSLIMYLAMMTFVGIKSLCLIKVMKTYHM
jgi:hypothetical protein